MDLHLHAGDGKNSTSSFLRSKSERWEFGYPHSPVQHPSYYLATILNVCVWVCNPWRWACTSDTPYHLPCPGSQQVKSSVRLRGLKVRALRHHGSCRVLRLCCYLGVPIQEYDELFKACWYAILLGPGFYWQRKRVVTFQLSKPFSTLTSPR